MRAIVIPRRRVRFGFASSARTNCAAAAACHRRGCRGWERLTGVRRSLCRRGQLSTRNSFQELYTSKESCANSNAMYDIRSVVQADKFLPVDVYLLHCLPRPDAFEEGLPLVQKAVDTERRPLSWVARPQETACPPLPSLCELNLGRTAARHGAPR
jgi:hypothetical protein